MANEARRGSDFVQSLERGLAVIRAFGPERPALTLSQVARVTGLTRAAARRFLLTLTELGYVRFDGHLFSLRPRILELGYAYLSTLGLNEVAAPHMEHLVGELNESSSVAVLDDDDITYVVRVPTQRIMTVAIAVGTRLPAYATSMGRVLLAALPPGELEAYLRRVVLQPLTARTIVDPVAFRAELAAVADQGFAIVDQELEDGLRSVAVPIRDATGQPAAALNMSAHASRSTLDSLRRKVVPALAETARRIEVDLQALASTPARKVGP